MWLSNVLARSLTAAQSVFSAQDVVTADCGGAHGAVQISRQWQTLGPFQIGTREASWGADPLEQHGGFRALEYNESSTYTSSLMPNATVKWSNVSVRSVNSDTDAKIIYDFDLYDSTSMKAAYGWAALQYQAWSRGYLDVPEGETQTVKINIDNVLEFYVGDLHFFGGDFYAYRRAPLILKLSPGRHRIDMRIVRDVRAMGGLGNPTVEIVISARLVLPGFYVSNDKVVLPDLVDGRTASPYGSVLVTNHGSTYLDVTDVSAVQDEFKVSLLNTIGHVRIMPGQTRPTAFRIHCAFECPTALDLKYTYRVGNAHNDHRASYRLRKASIFDPHKTTFLHPGGIVSYAILRPPSANASCPSDARGIPILVLLHGAGLEAEDPLVAHALDNLPDLCAFVLFPTGVTPWSGDDWHQWGFADVEAALASLYQWAFYNAWRGLGPDISRWLVGGHSNGGQGTWYALTHRPDMIFAAAPLSGYSSIQNYVSYNLWQPMDPSIRALIDGALSSYHHELLMGNADGIPIFQQHGGADDNVPVYHSRLMKQLIGQNNGNSTYSEDAGEGHWYPGVMTTDALSKFYDEQLRSPRAQRPHDNFTLTVARPTDTGPKNGVLIWQLMVPGRLGRVQVTVSDPDRQCQIKTTNVLDLVLSSRLLRCDFVIIDLQLKLIFGNEPEWVRIHRESNGRWAKSNSGLDGRVSGLPARPNRQPGGMDAILRSAGHFRITVETDTPAAHRVALQTSRNLCQYFGADTEIGSATQATSGLGNIIRISSGGHLRIRPSDVDQVREDLHTASAKPTVTIEDEQGYEYIYSADEGLVAIHLKPISGAPGALELVVWGADSLGLEIASRLVPMMTGVGQPDFVIADRQMMWKGAGGVLAMGFFDSFWKVSKNSYFT